MKISIIDQIYYIYYRYTVYRHFAKTWYFFHYLSYRENIHMTTHVQTIVWSNRWSVGIDVDQKNNWPNIEP